MNKHFSKNLSLLRKEKMITQKEAASKLGISPALLSHYEKGIRECGLDFLVAAADFYGVSCDYILGRTHNRTGGAKNEIKTENVSLKIENDELLDSYRNIIIPASRIIFDLLYRAKSDTLTKESCNMMMVSLYGIFRTVYSSNKKNPSTLFKIPRELYQSNLSSAFSMAAAKALCTSGAKQYADITRIKNSENLLLAPVNLEERYKDEAISMILLISRVEALMMN